MRLLKVFLANVAAFGIAAAISSSCSVDYPSTAFRCDPSGPSPNCPDDYICCSDDPSAIDITNSFQGALPDYSSSPSDERIPMFSGINNNLSTSGMCIQDGAVGDSGLITAPGCPVPCNPTWGGEDIATVCGGSGFLCCQTGELEEKDCVYDSANDCVRPARGSDVFSEPKLSSWATSEHATHQGPNGKSCENFLLSIGESSSAAFEGCVSQLTVADQRGFCLREDPANGVTACPADNEAYIDACENWAFENGKGMCN